MTIVVWAFCNGSGSVPGWGGPDPCPICRGRGEVHITYDNPQRCNYNSGTGTEAGWGGPKPCKVCVGIGVVRPVLFD